VIGGLLQINIPPEKNFEIVKRGGERERERGEQVFRASLSHLL